MRALEGENQFTDTVMSIHTHARWRRASHEVGAYAFHALPDNQRDHSRKIAFQETMALQEKNRGSLTSLTCLNSLLNHAVDSMDRQFLVNTREPSRLSVNSGMYEHSSSIQGCCAVTFLPNAHASARSTEISTNIGNAETFGEFATFPVDKGGRDKKTKGSMNTMCRCCAKGHACVCTCEGTRPAATQAGNASRDKIARDKHRKHQTYLRNRDSRTSGGANAGRGSQRDKQVTGLRTKLAAQEQINQALQQQLLSMQCSHLSQPARADYVAEIRRLKEILQVASTHALAQASFGPRAYAHVPARDHDLSRVNLPHKHAQAAAACSMGREDRMMRSVKETASWRNPLRFSSIKIESG